MGAACLGLILRGFESSMTLNLTRESSFAAWSSSSMVMESIDMSL